MNKSGVVALNSVGWGVVNILIIHPGLAAVMNLSSSLPPSLNTPLPTGFNS